MQLAPPTYHYQPTSLPSPHSCHRDLAVTSDVRGPGGGAGEQPVAGFVPKAPRGGGMAGATESERPASDPPPAALPHGHPQSGRVRQGRRGGTWGRARAQSPTQGSDARGEGANRALGGGTPRARSGPGGADAALHRQGLRLCAAGDGAGFVSSSHPRVGSRAVGQRGRQRQGRGRGVLGPTQGPVRVQAAAGAHERHVPVLPLPDAAQAGDGSGAALLRALQLRVEPGEGRRGSGRVRLRQGSSAEGREGLRGVRGGLGRDGTQVHRG
mmetsp:Transcript_1171/g.2598  ORF Transcript_1171/g.2598 Transcript_1171/m.2598 type:complete len:269 (+) Transcript_1171:87-893(+)